MIRINHLRAGTQRSLPALMRVLIAGPRGRTTAKLDAAQRRALDVLANEGGSTRDLEPLAVPLAEPAAEPVAVRSPPSPHCMLLMAPAAELPGRPGHDTPDRAPDAPAAPSAADLALMRALSITQEGGGFVFHAQRFGSLREAVDLARRSPLERWHALVPPKPVR